MKIWIDADSCPVKIREIAEKASQRTGTPLVMVSNRIIPHKKSELTENIVVGNNPDEADNFIFDNAQGYDIVITRDIPLADRLVKNDINVINDRGIVYTKENIRERLSIRNLMLEIRGAGLKIDEETSFNAKDVQNFSNSFDSLLTKLIKLCNN